MQTELIKTICEALAVDALLTLDFETYYATKARNGQKSYSLKNRTYPEYILGERYQTTGLGYGYNGDELTYVHTPDEVQAVFDEVKRRRAAGERTALVAHNAQFDGSIAAWRYGAIFDFYLCTRLMSTLLWPHLSASLRSLALRLWPDDVSLRKGGAELVSVDGVRYEYITPEQHIALEGYCKQDTNLCRRAALELIGIIAQQGLWEELVLMHITLRGAIVPQFQLDYDLLIEAADEQVAKKDAALAAANAMVRDILGRSVDEKVFTSNPRYATLLRDLGLVVPEKKSKTTGELTDALGKNDPDYIRLMIENPLFAPVYEARRALKSSIELSRAERMRSVGQMFDQTAVAEQVQANMPFFLNYYGADQTGRWSGGQKLNQQNLTRDGKHRLSLQAPAGYVINVCDLSNIELRVNMWFCGQMDILEQMRASDRLPPKHPDKYDYYCDVASGIFGRPITKNDKDERQMGKAAGLGLGFSMGWFGYQNYLASGPLGMAPQFISDSEAKNIKNQYDLKHYAVKGMWQYIANVVIPHIVGGQGELTFGPDGAFVATRGAIKLPSGRVLRYPNARYVSEEDAQGVRTRAVFNGRSDDGAAYTKNLWHGLVLENIVQATARDILGYQMVRIERSLQETDTGWLMGSVHDETLSCIQEAVANEVANQIEGIMRTPPPWATDVPLANEGGWARNYSK